ncbi:hypothetical protein RCL1_008180 [Eukaryota sp. TZLM3-RCL]
MAKAKKGSKGKKGSKKGKSKSVPVVPVSYIDGEGRDLTTQLTLVKRSYSSHCHRLLALPDLEFVSQLNQSISSNSPLLTLVINSPLYTEGTEAVFNALSHWSFLENVCMIKTLMSDNGLLYLAGYLASNRSILKLDLTSNHLSLAACESLGTSLNGHNSTLKELILDHNPIGDHGVCSLVHHLRWNPTLKILSLKYCNIGTVGSVLIGRDLLGEHSSSVLEKINLQGNIVDLPGLLAIGDGLQYNKTLTTLIISDCLTGDDVSVFESFCNGAMMCESLTHLDMSGTDVSANNAAPFANLAAMKKNLTRLLLPYRVGKDLLKTISESISANITACAPKKSKGKKKGGKKKKK